MDELYFVLFQKSARRFYFCPLWFVGLTTQSFERQCTGENVESGIQPLDAGPEIGHFFERVQMTSFVGLLFQLAKVDQTWLSQPGNTLRKGIFSNIRKSFRLQRPLGKTLILRPSAYGFLGSKGKATNGDLRWGLGLKGLWMGWTRWCSWRPWTITICNISWWRIQRLFWGEPFFGASFRPFRGLVLG